jgi:hypothetical protein
LGATDLGVPNEPNRARAGNLEQFIHEQPLLPPLVQAEEPLGVSLRGSAAITEQPRSPRLDA